TAMRAPLLWVATWLVTAPTVAHAEAPPPVAVVVSGRGCPDAAAIRSSLAWLLPSLVLVPAGRAGALVLQVDDRGPRYRVRIGATEREHPEAARNCEARARATA